MSGTETSVDRENEQNTLMLVKPTISKFKVFGIYVFEEMEWFSSPIPHYIARFRLIKPLPTGLRRFHYGQGG